MGWLRLALASLYAAAVVAPLGLGLILTSALLGRLVENPWARGAGALAIVLLPSTLVWLRVRRRGHGLPWAELAGVFNLLLSAGLCLGFADDTGRALRRHGDWFLGERNGLVARTSRDLLELGAAHLERFDPPPELASLVLHPVSPGPSPLVPTPGPLVGPQVGGDPAIGPSPAAIAWVHPLSRRALPGYEARRFGASRPPPRPEECELGHCGVDLGNTLGEPVFAIGAGVIERIELDASRGGRAGRYVRIGHREGRVVSRYIHLDAIAPTLKEGDAVAAGQLIGTVGRTGVMYSGPHLHFGLSLRDGGPGGAERYVDPEPLLRSWPIAAVDPARLAAAGMRVTVPGSS